MQIAAHNEAQRIEIIEDGWVTHGTLPVPRADRVRLRDDFAGIVRLIDIIQADDIMRGRLEDALRRQAAAPAPAALPDTEIVPVDEEPASE